MYAFRIAPSGLAAVRDEAALAGEDVSETVRALLREALDARARARGVSR